MNNKYNIPCDDSNSINPIDKACLSLTNCDNKEILDLWIQSEECYKCSPWKYLSLNPRSDAILKVNSTYFTNIFIETAGNVCLHKYKYHFAQNGLYSVTFNSSHFQPIITNSKGNNEYTAILAAFLFFFFLYIFVLATKALHKKMEEARISRFRARNMANASSSHLLTEEESNREMEPEFRPIRSEAVDISTSNRLKSLDTFRGLAITIMIFVNYKGGKYYFFNHSPWNGLTVADLVFPWFLWIMGVSLTFSIKSQLQNNSPMHVVLLRVIKRSVVLFALGIVINSLGSNHLPDFRIFGVLQRFALCYLVNAVLETLFMKPEPIVEVEFAQRVRCHQILDLLRSWAQWTVISVLIVIHTVISLTLSVPGCPTGYLGPGGVHAEGKYPNCTGGAAGYIDQLLLGRNHLHKHPTCKNIYDSFIPFDPEGILGVLTSCLTVQLGVAAGRIILYFPGHSQRLLRWIIWGVCLGLLGGFLCGWSKEFGVIPVNKNLWSLSFVCVTASFAFILLSLLYFGIDVMKKWDGSTFRVAGLNSILLYIGHEVTHNLFPWSWKPTPRSHGGILFMSIWGTALWLLIAQLCHKKKFYLSL